MNEAAVFALWSQIPLDFFRNYVFWFLGEAKHMKNQSVDCRVGRSSQNEAWTNPGSKRRSLGRGLFLFESHYIGNASFLKELYSAQISKFRASLFELRPTRLEESSTRFFLAGLDPLNHEEDEVSFRNKCRKNRSV